MNINDLDYSLSELNIAVRDHYDWAGKFLRLSLLGGEADPDILDPHSHLHCRFSHWLSLRINGDALDKDMVMVIDKNHKIMHDISREMMQSIINGKVCESHLKKYQIAQQNFIDSLDRYKEYLFSYRNLHDALTGLPLRHLLFREFPLVRQQCQNACHPLYVLMMDIDRFKSINDSWGHNAGDDVLRDVALALKDATRRSERIYRFGGEEFIILLEANNEEGALAAAERMRQHLQHHNITVGQEKLSVTVTGGLTKVIDTDSLQTAIGRADKAMYYGKNAGRNRCIMLNDDDEFMAVA